MGLTFSRHLAFFAGLGAGLLGTLTAVWLPGLVAVVLAANLFFATYLAISLTRLLGMSAHDCRRRAAAEDEPVWIIFLVTAAAIVVAVTALFVMVGGAHQRSAPELALAVLAVPLGWFTIHIMAAFHYAHLYWQRPSGQASARGGLDFPKTDEPCGSDFMYFALVIGMTAQTSDVEITDQRLRRVNALHAVASFFFNTVLIAAAVNVAVSLGN